MRSARLLTFGVGLSALVTTGSVLPLAHGQTTATATANATVQPAGPRPGGNGTAFLNIEGSANGTNGSLASFGVLDFAASAFNPGGQTASGVLNNTLTLALTETNAAFTRPATLNFFLTTNTAVSLSNAAGVSPLRFDLANSANSPFGVDAQLGTVGNGLFSLGSGAFTSTGTANTGTVDRYTLTLGDPAALNAFLTQLNDPAGTLRLVISSTEASGAATFAGAANNTLANRPALTFTPTFASAGGLFRQTTAGSWTPSGGSDWAPGATDPNLRGWNNDGTATAVFANAPTGPITIDAGNINAAGLQFDVNGYTIAAGPAAGNTLTLTGAHLVSVTNAADSATISAPVAGAVGLTKLGAGSLALTGVNTFAGPVNVLAGTLAVGADNALGDPANSLALNGGTLRATGNVALNAARNVSGTGGGLDVPAGNVLTVNGVVNVGNVTLANAGTVVLANTAGVAGGGNASNTLGVVTFNAAGGTLAAPTDVNGIPGVTQLGGVTVAAGVPAGGTANLNTNVFLAAGSTNPFTVTAAGATLAVNGGLTGGGTFVQAGPGTVVLNGDNGTLTGVVRQGGGGTLVIPAGNPNPDNVLGTGQLQANGGTLLNNTGVPVTLPNGVSLGASAGPATPGGFVIAGNTAAATVTFAGDVSLFGNVARTVTVNVPTTFTGLLAATTTGNTAAASLTVAGTGSLTLAGGAGANTLDRPVTLANTGGVLAGKVGAFAAVPVLTVAANVQLTIDGGAASGAATTDALNDAGLISLVAAGGGFGRVALTLGNALETIGGLQLGAAATFQLAGGGTVTMPAGLAAAGTYGAIGSGADFQNDEYFLANTTGQLLNAATAVPEPGTWALLAFGGLLAVGGWRGTRQ